MDQYTQTITTRHWNSQTGRHEYSFSFAFRNREEYLGFRQGWKRSYATLSQSIRAVRMEISATMRKRENAAPMQHQRLLLKEEAHSQMLMLAAAKQEACRQYLAAKPGATAAQP